MNDVRIYDHALSTKEVEEIAKGLVLHYPLNDRFCEATTNKAGTGFSGWNNSGACTRNTNDTSIPNPPTTGPVASIVVTAAGNCAASLGTTATSGFASKVLTFSTWVWLSSTQDANTIYVRSLKTDGNVGDFQYNGSTNPNTWPKQKWIFISKTITATSDATGFYICTYCNSLNVKRAFNGWQVEEKDHATPWTAPGTTRAAGAIYDTSGYGNNGTPLGTLITSTPSPRYSCATYFNGTDSGILIENLQLSNIINNQITYSFWIKPEGENGGRSVYFGSYNSNSWSIEKTSGNALRSYWNGSPDITCTGATITDGNWQHICIVKNGNTDLKVYINGISKFTSTATLNTVTFPTTYRIGRDTRSNDGTPYHGSMSDFRIYATALTAEQVADLYRTSMTIDNQGNIYARELVE